MKLRHIGLYLEAKQFDRGFKSAFGFSTRCLCNFVRRGIRERRVSVENYNTFGVQGRSDDADVAPQIVSDRTLRAVVPFDRAAYEATSGEARQEHMIAMFLEGVRRAESGDFGLPALAMRQLVDAFRQGGYVNRWTHKSRTFRGLGVKMHLDCELTMEQFVLSLRVEKKGETLATRRLLETQPDELIFDYKFKDIVVDGDDIVVTSKVSEPLCRIPVGFVL